MENIDKNNEIISHLLVVKNTAHLRFTPERWLDIIESKITYYINKYPNDYDKYIAYYILADKVYDIPDGLREFDFPGDDSVEKFYLSLL